MKISRFILAAMFSLATILSGGPQVSAQVTAEDTSFTSLLSGAVIDLGSSGEATFVEGSHDIVVDRGARQEEIAIAHGQTKIFVAIVDPGVTASRWDQDTIGNMAPWSYSFEIMGATSQPTSSWQLLRYTYYLNLKEVAYGEFHEAALAEFGLAVMVFGTESSIVEQIAWVQQHITIGEAPALELTGLADVESIIAGTSTMVPQVISGHGTTAADWKDQGLVSETEWVSPSFGTVVNWDINHWRLRYYKANAIDIAPEGQDDLIYLVPPDNRGVASINIFKDVEARTPAQWVERWTSGEFLANLSEWNYSPIQSVVSDNSGSVIFSLKQAYGEPIIQIYDVYINADGNTVITKIAATPEDIGTVYEDFWKGVTADDEYYPLTWTIEEIKALSAD